MARRKFGAESRPTLSSLKNLRPVDDVLAELKQEHKALRYHPVERPQELHMTYDKVAHAYHVKYDGDTYRMDPGALKTAIKFSGIPSADWLVNKPENRFGEIIQDECRKQDGLQLAFDRDNMLVKAFVDKDFVFMDDYELVNGMVRSLEDTRLKIRGIEVADHPSKEARDFRIVFGEKSIVKKDDVFTMLSVTTSQFGLTQNRAFLGTWRLVCLNGMLSNIKDHKSTWNHRGGRNKFFDNVGEMLSYVDQWGKECASLLNRARECELSRAGDYITYAMGELDILKPKQVEVVRTNLSRKTTKTAYDMWNAMTDAAKGLELHSRHRLEQASMEYLYQMTTVNQKAEEL